VYISCVCGSPMISVTGAAGSNVRVVEELDSTDSYNIRLA